MLTYSGGTKAHIINNNGQLIVGASDPTFTDSKYGGDDGGVNKVLTSDGVSGLKWTPAGGDYSSYTNQFFSGQQTPKTEPFNTPITLFNETFYNKLTGYPTIVDCVFNFSVSSNSTDLTITYTNNLESTSQSYTQSLSRNGHHIFPVKFQINGDNQSSYNCSITATVTSGNISTDVKDFYCLEFRQIKYPPA
jgi:hypothetical protein